MSGVVLRSRSDGFVPEPVSDPPSVDPPSPPTRSSSYRGILRQPRVYGGATADHVSLNEAAAILGCPISTVRRLVLTGRGRHGNPEPDDVLLRTNVEALAT